MHYLWALETPGVLPGFTPIHELGPQTGGQPVPDMSAAGSYWLLGRPSGLLSPEVANG